jgi:hypothetical protein
MKRSGPIANQLQDLGELNQVVLVDLDQTQPASRIALKTALISDDLPVPREPQSSRLLAPRPARNWRVLRSISAF